MKCFKSLPPGFDAHAATYPGQVGVISFYASAYGNADLIGDVVVPGAFDKWLAAAKAAGERVPVVWSHDYQRAGSLIGYCDASDIASDSFGLKFARAVLDLENETAATVYRNVKAGALQGASFSYLVGQEQKAKDGSNLLLELSLLEAGPCTFGMNPAAGRLEVVRGPGAKAGALPCARCGKFTSPDAHYCEACGTARVTEWPLGDDIKRRRAVELALIEIEAAAVR